MGYLVFTESFNQNSITTLIVSGVVTAVAVFLIVFFSIFNSVRNKRVLSSSPYIKSIREINKKYGFQVLANTYETKTFHLNSKRAFDNFDYYKRRSEFFIDNLYHFQGIVEKIDFNISSYKQYREELVSIPLTNDAELAKMNKMSLKAFNSREKKLANKMIKIPQMNYSLRIQWEYTSPAGRNHYSFYRDNTYEDIKSIVRCPPTRAKNDYIRPKPQPTFPAVTNRKPQAPRRVYTNDDIDDIE